MYETITAVNEHRMLPISVSIPDDIKGDFIYREGPFRWEILLTVRRNDDDGYSNFEYEIALSRTLQPCVTEKSCDDIAQWVLHSISKDIILDKKELVDFLCSRHFQGLAIRTAKSISMRNLDKKDIDVGVLWQVGDLDAMSHLNACVQAHMDQYSIYPSMWNDGLDETMENDFEGMDFSELPKSEVKRFASLTVDRLGSTIITTENGKYFEDPEELAEALWEYMQRYEHHRK